ncbi:MAG: lysylphosphatidylglycerol synthase domain-containing protein, partial [bacterium]
MSRIVRLLKNRWFIQLAVVAVLLAVALLQVDLKALGRSFSNARYQWLLLAALVYVGSRLVHALEWRITLRRVGHAPFLGLFGVLLIGTLVNSVVPASAGDVVKIQIVANRYGLSRAGLVAGRGAEAIVNAVLIVVFVLAALLLPNGVFASSTLLWVLAISTVAFMAVAVAVARSAPRAAPRWSKPSRLPLRLRDGIE